MHWHWPGALEVTAGAIWLFTSVVYDRQGMHRRLQRRGADPRALGPSLWIQRLMGLALLILGLLDLSR